MKKREIDLEQIGIAMRSHGAESLARSLLNQAVDQGGVGIRGGYSETPVPPT
jgi:hypothetical protein